MAVWGMKESNRSVYDIHTTYGICSIDRRHAPIAMQHSNAMRDEF